jgi:transposase-like protein
MGTRADEAIDDPYAAVPPIFSAIASSLLASQPPEAALLGPVAPGAIALIRGPRGVGKSWLALAMAQAIAGGEGLLGWTVRAAPVLYVEAAMSGALLGARLRAVGAAADLHIVCDEHLDLGETDDQARVMEALPEGGLLVLDGLSLLVRSGRAARNSFTTWLRMLRRSGHAVLLVEPTTRPVLAALADTLITLRPAQGEGDVSLAVEIASRRALSAGDRAFAVDLDLADGGATWTRAALVPAELRAVIEASRRGGTVRDIAARLGLPTSTAWRRLDKAKALGLIEPGETGGTAERVDPAPMSAPAVAFTDRRKADETSGTARTDLAAVSTSVLKRTLARRAALQGRAHAHRPGAAILAGYDDAALAAECARRLKPAQAMYAPMAAE